MSNKRAWHESGWAWELELFVLVFIVLGFIVPSVVELQQPAVAEEILTAAEQADLAGAQKLDELKEVNAQMKALLSGLIVIGLYIGHLIIVSNSPSFLSTPVVYLFSPLAFGGVTYYRLLNHTTLQGEALPLVSGSLVEKIVYPLVILTITILLLRLRMKRQLRWYKKIDWTHKIKAHFDKGIFTDFGSKLMPFIYPPREFWVCSEGILIRGSLYLLPLSFSHVQSIVQTKRRSQAGNQLNLSTSGHNPVRIQTTESRQPIMITPEHADEFVFHCAEANPHASHLFSSSATSHG